MKHNNMIWIPGNISEFNLSSRIVYEYLWTGIGYPFQKMNCWNWSRMLQMNKIKVLVWIFWLAAYVLVYSWNHFYLAFYTLAFWNGGSPAQVLKACLPFVLPSAAIHLFPAWAIDLTSVKVIWVSPYFSTSKKYTSSSQPIPLCWITL